MVDRRPDRDTIPRAKAAPNPATPGGRLSLHQRWGMWVIVASSIGGGLWSAPLSGVPVMRSGFQV